MATDTLRAVAAHLLILGDRDALKWVLRNERMAFEVHRRNDVSRLAVGDTLLIYTTRGCFHNPTRDRGRVIGRAVVTSPVESLQDSVVVMDREFKLGCTFELVALAPRDEGVVLADLVPRLGAFPNKRAWSARMRRPLLTLPPMDAALIEREFGQLVGEPSTVVSSYD
jgi:hypothetical protein